MFRDLKKGRLRSLNINDSAQTYQLAVAKDAGHAGQLVAFILTTEGSEISDKGLRQRASDTDGMGGDLEWE